MNKLENKNWSREENAILNIIIESWKLSPEKFFTLRRQIQKFEKSADFISLLTISDKDWSKLQQLINTKLSQGENVQQSNFQSYPSEQRDDSSQMVANNRINQIQQISRPPQYVLNNQSSPYSDDQKNQNQQQVRRYQAIQGNNTSNQSINGNYQRIQSSGFNNQIQPNVQKQQPFQRQSDIRSSQNFNNSQQNAESNISQSGIRQFNDTIPGSQQLNYPYQEPWRQLQINQGKSNGKNQEMCLEEELYQNQSFTSKISYTGSQQIVQNQQGIQFQNIQKGFSGINNTQNQIQLQQINKTQQQQTQSKLSNSNIISAKNPIIETSSLNDQQYFDNYLVSEFQSLNKKDFTKIFESVNNLFQILPNGDNEAKSCQFSNSNDLTIEDLKNLCVGVKKIFSYYPRFVQLVSVVLLFNHETNQGRLAQIYTGEGKSLIVAMLAVLLCKKKSSNVDIVTSSAVLAKRDSEEYTKFYKYFQLSVAHNIHKNEQIQDGVLPCYKCQIIYGDASSFQADILRHEYSEQGTMGNRKQQYAIIDEVDSMLIDGHRNKTLLSSPIPGMLDLSKVLTLIWDEICKVQQYLSTDFKVMITDKDNYYSVDLEEYLEQTLDKQLRNVVIEFIPHFRLKYINHMKKTWIKHAIQAKFHFKKDKDYVVNDGVVRIVDFQNTGVIQSGNTQWEKGLHQFIQLKHNLNVTPLSITTNYISNVTFFQRYQSKLLGLTGTLGSLNTQNLLAKQYKVDFIFVPPFKKRNLKEEFSIALNSEQEWLSEIKKAVETQMTKKRAVLIINKTIQEAEKVQTTLQSFKKNIVKYTDDSQVISKDIGPQGIVIATNLAGRGTDFITNQELEDNGGLHVIMSFLPQNIRTQEQGFGRTCRQGKKGTAQLIVQFKQNLYTKPEQKFENYGQSIEYYQKYSKNKQIILIDVVKFFRDENEKYYMDQIEIEMVKLLNEDKCFEKFCQIAKSKVNIKKNRSAFRSLEEKWGLYLEINQETGIQVNEIENLLNKEENSNPKYLILEALEQNDLQKINKAAQEKNDPQAQYYKGLLQLNNEQYQQGAESLLLAKQLFQSKIENERGFATAAKINQQQIQHYNDEEQFEKKKVEFHVENFEKLESGIFQQPEGENIRPMQLKEKKQVNQDRTSEKVNNHIKVYQKVIDNIDEIMNTLQSFDSQKEELELDWVKVIENDEQQVEESENEIKDQKEVINDGPLPRLGQIKKVEKKTSFWEYAGLFALGMVQFAIGAVISVYSCGAAMPLAKALMKNGFSDMVLSVTSCINGTPIDWETWRKKKLIDYGEALLLAGPEGIREALDITGNAMKSIKEEGFSSFISKLGDVSAQELQTLGSTLPNEQKQVLENSNQTLQQVSKIAGLNLNYEELKQMASDVIGDQVMYGTISQETGNQINELVNQSFNQASQNNGSLKDAFVQYGAKYLKAQIGQKKAEQLADENQEGVKQIIKNECEAKYNTVKGQIDNFEEYKQRLTNELNYFSKILQNCFQQDLELQKQIITIDLYFEILCDFQKVESQVNGSKLQQMIRQNFTTKNKKFLQSCQNLQISNKSSMLQFYNESVQPVVKEIVNHFFQQIRITEPLQILLRDQISIQMASLSTELNQQKCNLETQQQQIEKYGNNLNQNGTKQQYDRYNQVLLYYYIQMVNAYNQVHQQYSLKVQQSREIDQSKMNEIIQQSIQHLCQRGMILGNGLKFKNNIMQEFGQFLTKNIKNSLIQQLFVQGMQESIEKGESKYQNGRKLFSGLLKQSVELQVVDEIKNYIFKSKVQKVEQQVMEEFE